ncbi:MAG TPA: hypothetical protein VII41_18220 [Steroidobacteraceae bacterium]|jgi:hypothetical protein
MPNPLPLLDRWDNFYVIVGSSAAGLTGLTFVVIALASDAKVVRLSGLRTFITPIVLHFGAALWISALLCIPGHTPISLSACMIVTGATLSAYGATTTYRMVRGRREYRPALTDWIWNATLPSLCYLALLVAGLWALRQPAAALYVIGASALILLFVGIHNAWDLAVWITVERPAAEAKRDAGERAVGEGAQALQTLPAASVAMKDG